MRLVTTNDSVVHLMRGETYVTRCAYAVSLPVRTPRDEADVVTCLACLAWTLGSDASVTR